MSESATILAVDDTPESLALVVNLLTTAGYRVKPADSGELALAAAAVSPPDLVLLDVRMQGLDGLEVCRRLKARHEMRHVPVLLISSCADVEEFVRGLHMGAADYLTKPVEAEELLTRVRTHLALSQARVSLEQQATALSEANEQLKSEIVRRESVEIELRQSLRQAEQARQATFVALAETERKNRLYATLSQVNQTIVRCKSRDELLQSLCRVTVEFGKLRAAWIGLRAGEGKPVSLAARHAGPPDPLMSLPGQIQGCGITAEALSTGRPCISNDAFGDALTTCCQADLERAGIRSCAAFPFKLKGEISGVLGICSTELGFFNPEEIRLLEEVALDISYALEHLDQEEQLRQAQRMECIGRLAGGIAHDFNNLLSVILPYTELALEAVHDGDPLKADLLEIKRAGESAASLTRQLLAFSRKQVLQPVPLDLNRVVTDLDRMLRRIIGEDIELVQRLSPDLGQVKADPGQIEQAIMNLVVNARDAMPGGGRLTLETRNVDLDAEYAAHHPEVEPGAHVKVSVTDTGTGMDESTLARIFEPFFTTKGLGKGTGLGLSTTYGIVKQSGGSIWVRSVLGSGTCFEIYLPRQHSTTIAAVKPQPALALLVGTETILVVEDDGAVRNLAKRILATAGYTVLAAANGGEALLICEQHRTPIHLVLTDVVMPQMSGRALVDRLATVRPGIKVLFMSGYTDDAIVHHGVLEPGTQFIGKPFTQQALLSKLRQVLEAEPLERSTESPSTGESRAPGLEPPVA